MTDSFVFLSILLEFRPDTWIGTADIKTKEKWYRFGQADGNILFLPEKTFSEVGNFGIIPFSFLATMIEKCSAEGFVTHRLETHSLELSNYIAWYQKIDQDSLVESYRENSTSTRDLQDKLEELCSSSFRRVIKMMNGKEPIDDDVVLEFFPSSSNEYTEGNECRRKA